jgi:hypothetical protein
LPALSGSGFKVQGLGFKVEQCQSPSLQKIIEILATLVASAKSWEINTVV